MLADVDADGNNELLVGQEDGTIAFYRHTDFGFQHVVGDEDPFKKVGCLDVVPTMGLVTLVFALYLFLSEMKTYATKTRVGRQLSSSVDAAANYAKKRIRRVGSSEIGAEEEAKDDAAAAAL